MKTREVLEMKSVLFLTVIKVWENGSQIQFLTPSIFGSVDKKVSEGVALLLCVMQTKSGKKEMQTNAGGWGG